MQLYTNPPAVCSLGKAQGNYPKPAKHRAQVEFACLDTNKAVGVGVVRHSFGIDKALDSEELSFMVSL